MLRWFLARLAALPQRERRAPPYVVGQKGVPYMVTVVEGAWTIHRGDGHSETVHGIAHAMRVATQWEQRNG